MASKKMFALVEFYEEGTISVIPTEWMRPVKNGHGIKVLVDWDDGVNKTVCKANVFFTGEQILYTNSMVQVALCLQVQVDLCPLVQVALCLQVQVDLCPLVQVALCLQVQVDVSTGSSGSVFAGPSGSGLSDLPTLCSVVEPATSPNPNVPVPDILQSFIEHIGGIDGSLKQKPELYVLAVQQIIEAVGGSVADLSKDAVEKRYVNPVVKANRNGKNDQKGISVRTLKNKLHSLEYFLCSLRVELLNCSTEGCTS